MALTNTLTGLIPDVYAALDVVSRELTGFIPAVLRDMRADEAALNQMITSFQAPAATGYDITPGIYPPGDGGETIPPVTLAITKSRGWKFRWNGEEAASVQTPGYNALTIQQDQIAQRIRAAANEVEADLAALHVYASRAYGTAATTPFGTAGDFTDLSNTLKILKDNGAPQSDIHLILNTTAGAKFLGLQTRYDVQGDNGILRQGVLVDHMGVAMRESAQVVTRTAGAMASATTNNAGYAVGATVITLATAGTGVVSAGDVITFAGDTNKYVVAAATFAGANPADGDTITLAAPGLRVAIAASATAITVIATSARNMLFARNAIVLATRVPKAPPGGDVADDVEIITDPRTGLSFRLASYAEYHQRFYELSICWGVKMIKPEHAAILLG